MLLVAKWLHLAIIITRNAISNDTTTLLVKHSPRYYDVERMPESSFREIL